VIEVRPAQAEDSVPLQEWLSEPEMAKGFPMGDPHEIQEAAKRGAEMGGKGTGLTALYQGEPVGMGLLFLHTYKRLCHQCYHVLLVHRPYQHMGIGTRLLEELEALARSRGVELIHTEVYDDPSTLHFYYRRGYRPYGRQEGWIEDHTERRARVVIEKFILVKYGRT